MINNNDKYISKALNPSISDLREALNAVHVQFKLIITELITKGKEKCPFVFPEAETPSYEKQREHTSAPLHLIKAVVLERSGIGTKIYFHAKITDFLSTERVPRSLSVKVQSKLR